jgi:hypothetical protein
VMQTKHPFYDWFESPPTNGAGLLAPQMFAAAQEERKPPAPGAAALSACSSGCRRVGRRAQRRWNRTAGRWSGALEMAKCGGVADAQELGTLVRMTEELGGGAVLAWG